MNLILDTNLSYLSVAVNGVVGKNESFLIKGCG
jgi:hypothetical protein